MRKKISYVLKKIFNLKISKKLILVLGIIAVFVSVPTTLFLTGNFGNPKSAAYFVNSIWPHIDSWWNEKSTQNARKNFLSNYCVSSRKNLNKFQKIFSDIK